MTEPESEHPPWLAYVSEHREALAIGIALLAVAVALAYAAEAQRLRSQVNSPAWQKMRQPCANCDDGMVVIPVDDYGKDYNAHYKGESSNGNTGLPATVERTTADSSPDASGGGDS